MNRESSISTRASLIESIKNIDDHQSWSQFVSIYGQLIRRLGLSACLNEDEADEVVQDVLISVARHIGSFKYDPKVSSFKNWLSKMTRWRIQSQRRKRWRQKLTIGNDPDDSRSTGLLERIPSPPSDNVLDAEWAREMFEAAIGRVKKKVDAKQYQMYFLHVLKARDVADVCCQLKVNRGQIYLAKFRIQRAIEKELSLMAKEVERAKSRFKFRR
jgi:RNA polymerase sigma factor (sigma-70 family)